MSYLYGEIKRGVDGNYYMPNMGRASDQIHAYNGSGYNSYSYSVDTMYKLSSSLPTQVYKLFDNNTLIKEFVRSVGNKDYELKDHLGNVRVVISDAKQIVDNGTVNVVDAADNFEPEVLNYTDYYAFGQVMPGRQFNSGDYRYGFNGKENDNEVKGTGNQQDYGLRIYDSRIAKFLSVDPVTKSFPQLTPYQFASNDPIESIDIDGKEKFDYRLAIDNNNKSHVVLYSVTDIVKKTYSIEWNGWLPKIVYTTHKNEEQQHVVHFLLENVPVPKGYTIESDNVDLEIKYNTSEEAKAANIESFSGEIAELEVEIGMVAGSTYRIRPFKVGGWKGPVNYSGLKEPNKVGPGMKTTAAQRARIYEHNKKMNNGLLRSDEDGTLIDMPEKSEKGKPANMNQGEVDHIQERSEGGSNSNSNQRLVSKRQNLDKEMKRRKAN